MVFRLNRLPPESSENGIPKSPLIELQWPAGRLRMSLYWYGHRRLWSVARSSVSVSVSADTKAAVVVHSSFLLQPAAAEGTSMHKNERTLSACVSCWGGELRRVCPDHRPIVSSDDRTIFATLDCGMTNVFHLDL